MTFQEQLEIFRISCSVYPKEKRELENIRNSSPEHNPLREQYNQYVHDDVTYVENTLEQIRTTCGTNAKLLTWLLFVEGKTQSAVAQEYHLSRRQLQYSMDKWMHDLMENHVMEYKDHLFSFRCSCRMFESEINKLDEIRSSGNQNAMEKELYDCLQEDVLYTESVLNRIGEQYGSEARDIISMLYVKNNTQAETSEKYHMTRRKLQYMCDKWLKHAFMDKEH